MMKSNAEDVSTYLAEAPEERQDALTELRKLCLENLVDYEESMEYGMPSYKKDHEAEVEVAFASQKQYISLYILKQNVFDKYRHFFKKSNIGKGCIRYPNPNTIDFNIVKQMLIENYHSEGEIC